MLTVVLSSYYVSTNKQLSANYLDCYFGEISNMYVKKSGLKECISFFFYIFAHR